jgi:hypothetical protein
MRTIAEITKEISVVEHIMYTLDVKSNRFNTSIISDDDIIAAVKRRYDALLDELSVAEAFESLQILLN